MPVITLTEQDADGKPVGGDYPERAPIPNNSVFEATLVGIEEKDSLWDLDETDPSKGKKKQFSWKFSIIDPDGTFDGRWVWGNTGTFFGTGPQNKLRQWVQGVLDAEVLPEGYALDTESLHGLQCRIIVEAKEKQSGGISNRVKEVRPSKVAGTGPVVSSTPDEGEDEYMDMEEPF